jgi:hypothetical protein
MKTLGNIVFAIFLLLGTAAAAWPQTHDPLNPNEIDDLRDTNQVPDQRLKLLVQFAGARLVQIPQVRSDPKIAAADRPERVHELLQDFTSIYDQLGDNLDMYRDQNADLRKPLKLIIEGDSNFQGRLRQLKESSSPEEMKQYAFILSNAIDAVQNGAAEHRKLLAEENAKPRKKK